MFLCYNLSMKVLIETYKLPYQPTLTELVRKGKKKKNVLTNMLQPKINPRQQMESHYSLPTTNRFVFEAVLG